MTEAMVIAKLIFLITGMRVAGYEQGVAAFYAPGVMQEVCERRARNGWYPVGSGGLNCDWPCLVSGIEPEHIGEMWLVYHPGCSYHLCHVVDCGAAHDLPALRARNEVVEVSWGLARDCGWQGYVDGVHVWRIGGGDG